MNEKTEKPKERPIVVVEWSSKNRDKYNRVLCLQLLFWPSTEQHSFCIGLAQDLPIDGHLTLQHHHRVALPVEAFKELREDALPGFERKYKEVADKEEKQKAEVKP